MLAYVGVGSNLGDRWGMLRHAARALRATPGITLLRASRVYDTEPVGPQQPRYLNAVLELETVLSPAPLLDALLRIEAGAQRRRGLRWGPRTLDLDLLLFGGTTVRTPSLVVPHPRIATRRFVLEPLAELRPDLPVPGTGATIRELLARAPDQDLRIAGPFPA